MQRKSVRHSYFGFRPTGRMTIPAMLLLAAFALGSCSNKPPRKKQGKVKRKCDCPTWGNIDLRTDDCAKY